MSTLDRVIAARTSLLLDDPFFGVLALQLSLEESFRFPTAWTDGRTLGFNPNFVGSLTNQQLKGLIAHEVMHCATGHPWRRDGRQMYRFNVACDRAINQILKEAGYFLPAGGEMATGPEIGQSAEWIYARLPEDKEKEEGQQASWGEVVDAPKGGKDGQDGDGDEIPTEAGWAQMTKQAALAAKAQGKLPAGLDRFAAEVGERKVDWKSTLRRFVQERAKADYAWNKPNTRYISLGMYLPALESHALGEIAIAVDTSGSIDDVALKAAKTEVLSVMDECQPSAVVVYYADAKVARADRFERGDEIIFRPAGGGGTDFRPVFKACEEAEQQPVCLIYITDLEGSFPKQTEIPTIWVTDGPGVAPLGETVRMS